MEVIYTDVIKIEYLQVKSILYELAEIISKTLCQTFTF